MEISSAPRLRAFGCMGLLLGLTAGEAIADEFRSRELAPSAQTAQSAAPAESAIGEDGNNAESLPEIWVVRNGNPGFMFRLGSRQEIDLEGRVTIRGALPASTRSVRALLEVARIDGKDDRRQFPIRLNKEPDGRLAFEQPVDLRRGPYEISLNVREGDQIEQGLRHRILCQPSLEVQSIHELFVVAGGNLVPGLEVTPGGGALSRSPFLEIRGQIGHPEAELIIVGESLPDSELREFARGSIGEEGKFQLQTTLPLGVITQLRCQAFSKNGAPVGGPVEFAIPFEADFPTPQLVSVSGPTIVPSAASDGQNTDSDFVVYAKPGSIRVSGKADFLKPGSEVEIGWRATAADVSEQQKQRTEVAEDGQFDLVIDLPGSVAENAFQIGVSPVLEAGLKLTPPLASARLQMAEPIESRLFQTVRRRPERGSTSILNLGDELRSDGTAGLTTSIPLLLMKATVVKGIPSPDFAIVSLSGDPKFGIDRSYAIPVSPEGDLQTWPEQTRPDWLDAAVSGILGSVPSLRMGPLAMGPTGNHQLEIELFQRDGTFVAQSSQSLTVAPRSDIWAWLTWKADHDLDLWVQTGNGPRAGKIFHENPKSADGEAEILFTDPSGNGTELFVFNSNERNNTSAPLEFLVGVKADSKSPLNQSFSGADFSIFIGTTGSIESGTGGDGMQVLQGRLEVVDPTDPQWVGRLIFEIQDGRGKLRVSNF